MDDYSDLIIGVSAIVFVLFAVRIILIVIGRVFGLPVKDDATTSPKTEEERDAAAYDEAW